jgi:hypothetical protein
MVCKHNDFLRLWEEKRGIWPFRRKVVRCQVCNEDIFEGTQNEYFLSFNEEINIFTYDKDFKKLPISCGNHSSMEEAVRAMMKNKEVVYLKVLIAENKKNCDSCGQVMPKNPWVRTDRTWGNKNE